MTRFAQRLLVKGEYSSVRKLLDEDTFLQASIRHELAITRQNLEDIVYALNLFSRILSRVDKKTRTSWSELYIQCMSGELRKSMLFEEVTNTTKKLPSNTMGTLLQDLQALPSPQLSTEIAVIKDNLDHLASSLKDSEHPLRSAYDVHHETLRTTVVAQRVSLSKNSATLSALDTAYTKIVDRIHNTLLNFFNSTLINPQDLFLHEVFMYDSKSPHRDVFAPRPRFAIERALSSPHDYLDCECCEGGPEGGGLSASQPATAILYQLYLESGAVINTADLWSAFWTIVRVEGSEDEEAEEQRAL